MTKHQITHDTLDPPQCSPRYCASKFLLQLSFDGLFPVLSGAPRQRKKNRVIKASASEQAPPRFERCNFRTSGRSRSRDEAKPRSKLNDRQTRDRNAHRMDIFILLPSAPRSRIARANKRASESREKMLRDNTLLTAFNFTIADDGSRFFVNSFQSRKQQHNVNFSDVENFVYFLKYQKTFQIVLL